MTQLVWLPAHPHSFWVLAGGRQVVGAADEAIVKPRFQDIMVRDEQGVLQERWCGDETPLTAEATAALTALHTEYSGLRRGLQQLPLDGSEPSMEQAAAVGPVFAALAGLLRGKLGADATAAVAAARRRLEESEARFSKRDGGCEQGHRHARLRVLGEELTSAQRLEEQAERCIVEIEACPIPDVAGAQGCLRSGCAGAVCSGIH